MALEQYKESECMCVECKSMCMRPCWGTPEDIQKIIDEGLGNRLWLDYCYGGDEKDIKLISPALKSQEGKTAQFIPISTAGCTFWKDGLCELHDLNLKPSEGKFAICKDPQENLHEDVKKTWETKEGKELVKKWRKKYGLS